ncbi:MAG: hypothetical protein PHV77_00550 [Candidatus Omnitrophica bacterium]|jgi:hypothetical protein|nr:hypothetical protein [Candidatus Omnitrophota bacterium]
MEKKLSKDKLIEKAESLGIDIKGEPIYQSSSGRHEFASEYEIQRRIMEKESHNRATRLFWLALISALASLVSAIAAWTAILK